MVLMVPWAFAQKALPYSYGFEDGNLATDGWQIFGTTSSYTTISTDAKHTGDYGFQFYYSEQNAHLMSPLLTGTDSGVALSFYYTEKSSQWGNEQFYVGYTTDETNTDPTTFSYGSIMTASTSWQLYENVLPANVKRIAIKYVYNDALYLYIDDFSFDVPSSCVKPMNLNAEATSQTATLTWTSDASQWQVAYSKDATANPDDNIVGLVDVKSFTKDNLDLGYHYFWVRSYCDAINQSAWASTSVYIGYCVPAPTSMDGTGITNVTFGIDPNIVNNNTTMSNNDGIRYLDCTSEIGALQAGVEAEVSITYGHTYSYGTFIWVDWNNDLDFEDDGEILYYGISTGSSSAPHTLTAIFTIPPTKTPGDYCMRIGGADSGFDGGISSSDPCYTGTYAAFQDYTLRVLEAPSCLTPTGLALNLDGQKINATWDGTASTYNIDINGTVTNNVTNPYKFDIELETTYTVKVQANCPGDETSEWSNPVSLTTPACWGGHVIEYTLVDSYNDGWEDAYIKVIEGCDDVIATLTVASDESPKHGYITLCGEYYRFVYTQGQYPSEYSWTFSEGSTTLFSGSGNYSSDGEVLYTIGTTLPIPTDLDAGTPGKHDAELSWTENGTATAWQICLDGDEDHLIDADTNPYTIENLDPQTDYTVKVRAYIDATHQSCWSDELDFTTEIACQAPTNFANETPGTHSVVVSWTENGTATEWQIYYVDDMGVDGLITVYENPYTWTDLNQDTEYTAKVRAVCGGDDGSSQWSNEINFSTDVSCARPTNLTVTGITTKSATLSWQGSSDSYVLEYRPWHQVGNDQLATSVLTTYNYDLSGFTGTGSVAIRHYDVSDKFMLNVDDIVVRNGSDEIIYSQDFESGSIPSNITNMDLDGDGYIWGIRVNGLDNPGNPTGNGNYSVSSASWISGVGAIHPDNWLIISGIEFGGSLSFVARGQDPEWPAENFAVYVSLESDIVEVPVAGTSYEVNGLQPNTPYAWQVTGVCGTDHSRTVSSFFKTQDDRLVFATDGDWDDIDNWTDMNGDPATALPTKENNVRIDAEATIPAGYVAEVNKATINGGLITIEEGGQLKHASASLSVTLHKEITAYDSISNNHYYFISTPFDGVTMVGDNSWSHITNLADNKYDLYGFDASAAMEWVNWKSSSTASVFTSGSNYGLKNTFGYLYANSEDIDLEFVGTAGPTNINPTYSITYNPTSTQPFNGFVLVGNPFTCNAYVTFAPAGGSPTEIDFYVMNGEGDGYTLSETNVTLAPMQGAFFWADADGDVTFSSVIPSSKALSGALNINLTQNGVVADQARIRFGEGLRLAKASFRDNTSTIYMTQDDGDFAVVYAKDSGEMPLNFKAESTGSYTLSFKLNNANVGYLHLFDNLTGEDVNLLTNPDYSFIGSPRDAENRFIMRFSEATTNDIFVYQNGDELIVIGEGKLQVFDIMGRFIGSYDVNGNKRISASTFANGVYVFRMIGNEVMTQKIVVR